MTIQEEIIEKVAAIREETRSPLFNAKTFAMEAEMCQELFGLSEEEAYQKTYERCVRMLKNAPAILAAERNLVDVSTGKKVKVNQI